MCTLKHTHTTATVNCFRCAVTGTERLRDWKDRKGGGMMTGTTRPQVFICVCEGVCVCERDRHDESLCKCTRGQSTLLLTPHNLSLTLNQRKKHQT